MVLLRPLCKYCATITRVQDIPFVLTEAIAVAQSGTPGHFIIQKKVQLTIKQRRVLFFLGPVFVEFPIDSLYPYNIVLRESGIVPNPKSFIQKVVNT